MHKTQISSQAVLQGKQIMLDQVAKKAANDLLPDGRSLDNIMIPLSAHAIMARTDRRGLIVDVNDKFCEISGYSRAELIGKSHNLVNSGLHPSEFWHGLWRTIASGEIWHGEICNRRKNGALYWVESTIAPQFDNDGHIDGYLAIRTDVTRQKTRGLLIDGERLALKEVLQGAGLASACELILDKLLEIDPDMCLAIMQREGHNRLSHVASVNLSTRFVRFLSGLSLEPHLACCSAAVADNACVIAEDISTHPAWEHTADRAADEGLQSCWSSPIQGKNGPVGAIDVYYRNGRKPSALERSIMKSASDVLAVAFKADADRRQLLQAKTNALTLAESRRLFIANMNHEMRTPLNHILGFTDLLLAKENSASAREALSAIKSAGVNMLEKAKKAIEIANSHRPVEKTDFALLDFWETEIVPIFSAYQEKSERDLDTDFPIDDVSVHFSQNNLKQALTEVIDNAYKFTRSGDHIDIHISLDRRLRLAHIEISDNGPGMATEFVSKAAEAFEREDGGATQKTQGMGLGLTTANKLMLQSLGALEIISQPGEGARVRLSVPMSAG